MPNNFPEVWRARVETNLRATDEAPWLYGVDELDTEVLEVGTGTVGESNIIHLPTSDFEVDVLINNSTYPLALQNYSDSKVTISLDKYQTKVINLTDDQVMGAAYSRIDAATRTLTQGVLKNKYAKAIHALAPADNAAGTPVLLTTGEIVGGGATGRRRFVYDDLVRLKDAFDKLEVPMSGRRIVLCSDHWNDALLDRKNFGDKLVNYNAGGLAPIIAGFEIHGYVANPYYTGTEKNAFASTPATGDHQASVAFYVPNIARKTGLTKQYYTPSAADPQNQSNKYAIRHYFIALPKLSKYFGAIASEEVTE